MSNKLISSHQIDSQLSKLTKNISKINTSSSQDNEESSSSAILTMYDQEFRPQIIQRPVTILRRTEPSQANDANDKKATKAFKTFEQRQQEYAEARLRILGAAKNPEEDASSDDGYVANLFARNFCSQTL
jgi:SUZ domain